MRREGGAPEVPRRCRRGIVRWLSTWRRSWQGSWVSATQPFRCTRRSARCDERCWRRLLEWLSIRYRRAGMRCFPVSRALGVGVGNHRVNVSPWTEVSREDILVRARPHSPCVFLFLSFSVVLSCFECFSDPACFARVLFSSLFVLYQYSSGQLTFASAPTILKLRCHSST